jgi:phosphate transport system permease protein
MLWVASVFTIGILVSIIGYILFRGFVSDVRTEYRVIAKGPTSSMMGEEQNVPVSVIVHKGVKVSDLTVKELRSLFIGATKNWGLVSEQDIQVRVFAPRHDSVPGNAFDHSVMRNAPYGDNIRFFDTDEAIIDKVALIKGSIGYISQKGLESIHGKKVKVVPIRTIAVVANREVFEIKNNVKLRYLDENQLADVFTGKAGNWRQVGGGDLPVRVVGYHNGDPMTKEFSEYALNGAMVYPVVTVDDFPGLVEVLEKTSGAVGFCRYADALKIEDRMVKLERRKVKANITPSFFVTPPKRAGVVGGVSTIIINTIYMILLTLLFSTPIGVMAAIFLTEYAKQGKLVKILRFGTETLAGIPSIIFGLFGFLFFVSILKLGIGLLSGTLTITMMILPTIVRASEEAIKAVPVSYREGSLALGATKWQTIVRSVLPPATPGILTGVILAIGRAIGETAALLFTMGTDYRMVKDLSSSARTLSVHLYILVKEGLSFERAFATGTILIVVILVVNYATNRLVGRMAKMSKSKI